MGFVVLFTIAVPIFVWIAKKLRSWDLMMVVCVVMICIAGLRHGYIDTRAYRHGHEALQPAEVLSANFLWGEEFEDSKDKGFAVLSALIKQIFPDSQAFLFIMSLITVGLFFWGFIRQSPNMELSIFLFIATGLYIDTMNGLRQCLVAAVLFYFLPNLLKERKMAKYMLLVALMSTIHLSALIFVFIYFLADKPAWSPFTWIITGLALLAYAYFNSGVGAALVELLDGTVYGEDYADMLLQGNTSVNVIRVAVAAAPIVLSLVTRGGEHRDSPMYNIVFHMSLINLLCWIFATKVLYFYRLAIYFMPYMILMLCYEVKAFTELRDRRLVTNTIYGCYFAYHMYSCYVMWPQLLGYLKY